ncbi:MAG TPA: NAD(P)H-hydrate dehydratase [Bacteroidales bacterium]|nr:NAD(P)H-hydrate dehydratase [Bacteroidales bacterium]HCI54565.1 bifunctional ADP-dependent NAD(P)H-hydrate dehydratase/NAD(P)H-hydrate epimerase [Bacteroidales bacterium]HRC89621.1 NAD(P)H-hydrate dehydratase [Bacteroidales bacterium]
MKIFTGQQIKEIDKFTIENEPISSVDLMERAAGKIFSWIVSRFGRSHKIVVVAGPGNNGGDGLALARMLALSGYETEVFYIAFSKNVSPDWKINMERLEQTGKARLYVVNNSNEFPVFEGDAIIIDAIFGTGLSRPAEGLAAEVITRINESNCIKISVDVPSGLFTEDNSMNNKEAIVRADYTLSFQFPKLAFMFAENYIYTGEWYILDIGLHPDIISDTSTPYCFMEESLIRGLLKKRKKFDHKGIYGHGLMIAGSSVKTGAAILSAKAALRAGIGLITCHVPSKSVTSVISSLPEAMIQCDKNSEIITSVENFNEFTAVGAGPGIGKEQDTASTIYKLICECKKPLVLDADALNIIAANKEWHEKIPPDAIITPHPKEFERLAGKTDDGYSRLMCQVSFSKKHNCIVILKGAYTSISLPDGRVFFNSTGNPGMATAGSGDVLTGIILSLLAQSYRPADAALVGVYIHGLAGDIAAGKRGMESIIASDIADNLGEAYCRIRGEAFKNT